MDVARCVPATFLTMAGAVSARVTMISNAKWRQESIFSLSEKILMQATKSCSS